MTNYIIFSFPIYAQNINESLTNENKLPNIVLHRLFILSKFGDKLV